MRKWSPPFSIEVVYFWLAYHNLHIEKIYSPVCFLSFPY
jgi:hypothetical protein